MVILLVGTGPPSGPLVELLFGSPQDCSSVTRAASPSVRSKKFCLHGPLPLKWLGVCLLFAGKLLLRSYCETIVLKLVADTDTVGGEICYWSA